MPTISIHEVVEEVYSADSGITFLHARDICSAWLHNPGVDKDSMSLLYLKEFESLPASCVGHRL
ncbi:MAG: hypothetical protein ACTXOO_00310 [Sodalis sp. (in: enterobacteria)]